MPIDISQLRDSDYEYFAEKVHNDCAGDSLSLNAVVHRKLLHDMKIALASRFVIRKN
jgi:hypothetical protein